MGERQTEDDSRALKKKVGDYGTSLTEEQK